MKSQENANKYLDLKNKIDTLVGVLYPDKNWHISERSFGISIGHGNWFLAPFQNGDPRGTMPPDEIDLLIMESVIPQLQRDVAEVIRKFSLALADSLPKKV